MGRKFTYYYEPSSMYSFTHIVDSSKALGPNAGVSDNVDTRTSNLIIVAVSSYAPVADPILTDNQLNTWNKLTTYTDINTNGKIVLYYCINPTTSATHTFTLTQNGSYPNIFIQCFASNGTPVFSSDIGAYTIFLDQHVGSIAAPQENCLYVTAFQNFFCNTFSIDSGFTISGGIDYLAAVRLGSCAAYKIKTDMTAENPLYTCLGTIEEGTAVMAVFKPN